MSALDAVLGQLDADTITRMAAQLGATPEQTQSAIQAALPLLMGAMQRNAATPEGAQALHHAVVRDHQDVDLSGLLGGLLGGGGGTTGDGGGLSDLMGALAGALSGGEAQPQSQRSPLDNGTAILGHIFGAQQPRAAAGVARASGLDSGMSAQLLAMLAPMLMGALGKATQQQGLDAGGLGGMLGLEVKRMGGQGGGLQQILGSVLDKDGDGDVDASDLIAAGSGLFSQFMRG